ncbi:PQQ-binding-like beta-propeller repeat protein [Maridesulfovibrio sp.]|uniref:PQQ-binding-like beta-propeller repeat protein n=1 Tax=Maridesulfovibrio sp. TaxID=2795000 RepID=UPI002A188166|nr:PQQ-binding-like beta-propeller repeat protein [Maridesulfovibrio sp.]
MEEKLIPDRALSPKTLQRQNMNISDSTGNSRHSLTLTAVSLIAVLSILIVFASPCMATPGSLIWNFAPETGKAYPPAIGSDGILYVGGSDGVLYALKTDKTEKWKYQTTGEIYSPPTIGSDGTIYVGASDQILYALNSDGSEKWKYQAGSSIGYSPAIGNDGTIYVATNDGKLYAVNSDGSEKWIYDSGKRFNSAPVIGPDGTVYVEASDDNLYAIQPDGTLKWTYEASGSVYFPPAIGSNGVIYFGSDGADQNLYAVRPDGTLKWKFKTDTGISSSPAIGSGGVIYFGTAGAADDDQDGYLYALNADGSERWKYTTEGYVGSPAIASDGTIYIHTLNSKLYAIKADGSLKWSADTSRTTTSVSPAIGNDGTIYYILNPGFDAQYLRASEGDSGGLANTEWPRSQKDNQNTGASESGSVFPSETQADGVSVSISESVAKEMDGTELTSKYNSGGFTPKSNVDSFNATIDINGGCATFRISSATIPTGKVSDLTLMKFYNTNGTSKEYSNYALTGPEYNIDGYWWVTDADGNHLAQTDDTTLGTEYFIYFVIKDNGSFDEDRDLGEISDPVAVGTSTSSGSASSTGCTLNPQATFSVEWLLLLLAPLGFRLRHIFKR